MGDFFDGIVIFLEEYYVYVIGVGLILILMLIGLLTSRGKGKKKTKTEEPMANINEVNTGSINDVANTLQSDVMQPVDVIDLPIEENVATPISNEMDVPGFTPIAPEQGVPTMPEAVPIAPEQGMPTMPEAAPIAPEQGMPTMPEAAPIAPEQGIRDAFVSPVMGQPLVNEPNTVEPIVEEIKPIEEITPIDNDRFDKTEVMDFSMIQPQQTTEANSESNPTFIIDQSQYDNDSILNGENSSAEEPKI